MRLINYLSKTIDYQLMVDIIDCDTLYRPKKRPGSKNINPQV